MSNLLKQRYLDLLSSGVFSSLGPATLHALHAEVGQYLRAAGDLLDTGDRYALYELQFHLLLLTNHDVEAKSYLDQFNDQFAAHKSQKIRVLRLMYAEATGDIQTAISTLGSDPDELRAARRLATLSRRAAGGAYSAPEYIQSLTRYLDLQPADEVVWAELGDVYSSVGHYDKAAFCFKEVLLHRPLAHNMFYKAGLNLYLRHLYLCGLRLDRKDAMAENVAVLEHARDCFLRSVEINGSYTKGWLGVYLVAQSSLWESAAGKALYAARKSEQVLADMPRLARLGRQQLMRIEGLADAAAFEAFLAAVAPN
ncbi:hypothetical protein METBIDRAFT_29774 [Metschnikowia bicuspidata var. bicuspidata NRRL YB-4993]|uniref:ER membrane protein complex subunit 2 n=1 Tax=Metschnikowia bicuspidata var. bicuspidata NRRL YB-4993 TaxID=869754 RepID=A0A1A0HGY6_9ASCO|nr:hypothetical protein METBIDRAFT_29774 [Metschnikowia bicuspidata var. bicuspidata NRRL YB-4993]OBA23255.1 hypothetical protein METBIDRAFT_29774 [Metschnikowia bicuspidata var. bicuspidata NRRL YB-4993]